MTEPAKIGHVGTQNLKSFSCHNILAGDAIAMQCLLLIQYLIGNILKVTECINAISVLRYDP